MTRRRNTHVKSSSRARRNGTGSGNAVAAGTQTASSGGILSTLFGWISYFATAIGALIFLFFSSVFIYSLSGYMERAITTFVGIAMLTLWYSRVVVPQGTLLLVYNSKLKAIVRAISPGMNMINPFTEGILDVNGSSEINIANREVTVLQCTSMAGEVKADIVITLMLEQPVALINETLAYHSTTFPVVLNVENLDEYVDSKASDVASAMAKRAVTNGLKSVSKKGQLRSIPSALIESHIEAALVEVANASPDEAPIEPINYSNSATEHATRGINRKAIKSFDISRRGFFSVVSVELQNVVDNTKSFGSPLPDPTRIGNPVADMANLAEEIKRMSSQLAEMKQAIPATAPLST